MSTINYPSWFKRAPFTVKAGWLCSSGHARDYSHACSILAGRGRKKPRVVVNQAADIAAKRWDLRES